MRPLGEVAAESEVAEARRLVQLTQERRYNRGKDLQAESEHYRQLFQ